MAADCDLAIIGGGLAGASAAWHAAQLGLRCVLVEKGDFPRDKVCGEYFSAEGVAALQAILPAAVAAAPRLATAVFHAQSGYRGEFTLPAPGLGISRLRLDAALWHAAGAAGCELVAKAPVAAVDVHDSGVTLRCGGTTIRARHLIVATGRWWSIAGLRASTAAQTEARATPWVGVKARFTGMPLPPRIEMFYFQGGYCGLAPVENGWMNACCLIHRERARDLAQAREFGPWISLAAAHPALAERLAGVAQATPTVTTAPVAVGPRAATLGPVLLAGDAAGFIDPFTGDGMARAVLSGRLAAAAIAEHGAGAAPVYAAQLQAALGRSFLVSKFFRRCIAAPAWAQAAAVRALTHSQIGPRAVALTRWRGVE